LFDIIYLGFPLIILHCSFLKYWIAASSDGGTCWWCIFIEAFCLLATLTAVTPIRHTQDQRQQGPAINSRSSNCVPPKSYMVLTSTCWG